MTSIFNWKKASAKVLSLSIQKGAIGLAVASHPSSYQEAVHELESIPLSRRALAESVPQQVAEIVHQYNICGFVVAWPVQQDTGKLGYSCGLVLNTLERILERGETNDSSPSSIVTADRPICLWDGAHAMFPTIGKWGRCPDYARSSKKSSVHLASKEQYHVPSERNAACQVMEDFLQVNWPHLYNPDVHKYHHAFPSQPTDEIQAFLVDTNSQKPQGKTLQAAQ